jgi:hypothetical protein
LTHKCDDNRTNRYSQACNREHKKWERKYRAKIETKSAALVALPEAMRIRALQPDTVCYAALHYRHARTMTNICC